MKNWWIKLGCFLTGYNYGILKSCSEASKKTLKKYTSAILIISIIWGFVGYTFTDRYLQLDMIGSIVGAIIMVTIAIQIERQIILTIEKNKLAIVFRLFIALIMAFLGSIIIDQIIFKDDIEIQKEYNTVERVNKALPERVSQINDEIFRLDSIINEKNLERTNIINDVTNKPIIKLPGFKSEVIKDGDSSYTKKVFTSVSQQNPKAELIPIIDQQIKDYSDKRDKFSNMKIGIRDNLEKQFREKTGFLDELEVMVSILVNSKVALIVWLLWFGFLVAIELFIVTSKFGNNTLTDYDKTILHQKEVRISAINQLTQQNNDTST
jgi:hypothetical protein